mmetsp:Transcript_111357/g.265661  ORF Transcript_111357/g.265661 Transcript_111357/m.265661 type:complete len:432 (+) Transcript_111357:182-1477(+)
MQRTQRKNRRLFPAHGSHCQWNCGGSSLGLDFGGRQESFKCGDAHSLGSSGLGQVLAGHLPVHHDLQANALLAPLHDLVDGGGLQTHDLSQAFREAQPGRDVLCQVAVLQIWHELAVNLFAGVLQAVVGSVGVHASLERGGVLHLPIVAVQVPLLQRTSVLHVQALGNLLHLPAQELDLIGHAGQNRLREVIDALVEEGGLILGIAIPALGAPSTIHHAGVDDHARIAEADAQVVRTLQHLWVHAKKALELSEGLLRCRHGGHGCKNVVLSAEDGGLLAPLREAACPGQCLEAAEDHVLGLVPKLGGEQDVAAGARGHRGHDGARLHVGRELLEVLAMCEGWNHKQDQVSILGDGGVVGDVLGLRLHDSTTWGCELELRITQGILPLCGLIGEEGHGDGLVPHCKEARGDLRSIPAAAAQDRELCIASAHG